MSQTEHIPARFREDAQRMAAAFRQVQRAIIAAHVNLDGDAIGSMGAAGWILRALGAECVLYSATGLPPALAFCPLPGSMHTGLGHLPLAPQWAILLDCGEAHRLGPELAAALPGYSGINMDHHLGSNGMGSHANWVEPTAAATAQLMAYVALALELPLAGPLAQCLALGLITDTGGFCHGNTTADIFALCALLERGGCRLHEIRQQLDNNWSLGRMRLWGRLMERVRLEQDGTVAFCSISLADLRQCQAVKEDAEGFVEHLRRLTGVQVAALLREDSPGCCRINLRSHGSTDVQRVAASLGGGGHRNAAGASLRLEPLEAERVLLEAIRRGLA